MCPRSSGCYLQREACEAASLRERKTERERERERGRERERENLESTRHRQEHASRIQSRGHVLVPNLKADTLMEQRVVLAGGAGSGKRGGKGKGGSAGKRREIRAGRRGAERRWVLDEKISNLLTLLSLKPKATRLSISSNSILCPPLPAPVPCCHTCNAESLRTSYASCREKFPTGPERERAVSGMQAMRKVCDACVAMRLSGHADCLRRMCSDKLLLTLMWFEREAGSHLT